ncbi:MAG: helix-turn-helix transcriptional regulator [Lentisphaeria bacterium]|nr:helix-turn-helix transcriptional regulator [Lentisphaeria bacterium]
MKILENSAVFDDGNLPFDYKFDGGEFYYRKNSSYSRKRPLFLEPPAKELLFSTGIYEGGLLPGAHYLRKNAPFLSVEYIQEGNLYVRLDGRMYELETGEIFLMQPFRVAEFSTGKSFSCRKLAISIHGRLLTEVLKQSGLDRVDLPGDPGRGRLEELLGRFGELVDRHGREAEHRNGLLCYELLQLLQSPAPAQELPPKLAELLAYMEEHLAEPLSLEMLSARYGCSRNQLINVFRSNLHETPYRLLSGLRMRKARELLLSRDELSIKEISVRAGYSNALNFSTEFKKRFKLSPGEYRRIEH